MDKDITFGGFIPSNIRREIIKECIESGDPQNYFMALQEVMGNIQESIDAADEADQDFWGSYVPES